MRYIWNIIYAILGRLSPKALVSLHYRRSRGAFLKWKNPQSHDEKINCLKFYDDRSNRLELADKYREKEFVAKIGVVDMYVY